MNGYINITNNMENFVDKFKKYFDNTPEEKILEDWDKTEKYDSVDITVEKLIQNTKDMQMPYEKEINDLLKELFYENYMDDNDWLLFLVELEKHTGVSIKSISKDIQIGLSYGHTIEKQLELIHMTLKRQIK